MTRPTLIYLDACTIIELLEKTTAEALALAELLAHAGGETTCLRTSELTLAEVLVDPLRGLIDQSPQSENPGSRDRHGWYLANLAEDSILIRTCLVTRPVLMRAALMRARIGSMRMPDAIHAATAYEIACSHFITGDRRLIGSVERDPAWRTAANRFDFVPLEAAAIDRLTRDLD